LRPGVSETKTKRLIAMTLSNSPVTRESHNRPGPSRDSVRSEVS
jgi:hypothetical protein